MNKRQSKKAAGKLAASQKVVEALQALSDFPGKDVAASWNAIILDTSSQFDKVFAAMVQAANIFLGAAAAFARETEPILRPILEEMDRQSTALPDAPAWLRNDDGFEQFRAYTLRAVASAIGGTITPEDTLRAAGIDDARQAEYQRKMSAMLGGRA